MAGKNGNKNSGSGSKPKKAIAIPPSSSRKAKRGDTSDGGASGSGGVKKEEELSFRYATRPAEDLFVEYGVDPEVGLTADGAARRLASNGPNRLPEAEKDPLWWRFLEMFFEPLVLLLLAAAVVSLLVGQLDDALSITAAVVIVSVVAFVQEYQSEKSIEALGELVAHECSVLRDGREERILAEDLVTGDVVILRTGDRVSADLRLVSAVELKVNESVFTGEAKERKKSPDLLTASAAANLSDRSNVASMGTLVSAGSGRGVVFATGEQTMLGIITTMMKDVEEKRTPLQKTMDKLGGDLSIFSFGIIAVIFLIGMWQGTPLLEMFTIGVSLAVAAIPEGLPVVVTVTLAVGVLRMSRRNAIVRRLPAVEALGATSVICSDKTGTLTRNEMTVTHIFADDEGLIKVSGAGYATEGKFMREDDPSGAEIDADEVPALDILLRIGNLCNNAQLRDGKVIGYPTEGALLVAAEKGGLGDLRETHERLEEIPFSSGTKWMGVCAAEAGGPPMYYVKGATEFVLERCTSRYTAKAGPGGKLTRKIRDAIGDAQDGLARRGLRILALAYGPDIDALTFVGLVGIMDPPRDNVRVAIEEVRASGVHIAMITGDLRDTAVAIAEQLGFYSEEAGSRAMSAGEVEAMTEEELSRALDDVTVFYRMAPQHKLKIVSAYRHRGEIVAMTGDGVNDAPALKLADIGISMGITGTDVSKEAADMILVDDNFSTIVSAIEEGKCIFANIKNFLQFQLTTSIAALTIIALSALAGFPLPLNPMQVLWINIIMDGPPAQSLGVEPVDKEIMKKPPRDVEASIFSWRMAVRILLAAAVMVVGTLFVFMEEMNEDGEVTDRDRTMAFTTFVMFQMWNALNCRSSTKSVFGMSPLRNKMFLYAVGGSIAGQMAVMYIPWFQEVFDCVPLSGADLAYITALTFSVTLLDEVRKVILRVAFPATAEQSRKGRLAPRARKYGEESDSEEGDDDRAASSGDEDGAESM